MKRKDRLTLKAMGIKVIDIGRVARVILHVLVISLFVLRLAFNYSPADYRAAVEMANAHILMASIAEDSLLTQALSRAKSNQFYRPEVPDDYYEYANLDFFYKLEKAQTVAWDLALEDYYLVLRSEYWDVMMRVDYDLSGIKRSKFLDWKVVCEADGRLYFISSLKDIHDYKFWFDHLFYSFLVLFCLYLFVYCMVYIFSAGVYNHFYDYYYPLRYDGKMRVEFDGLVKAVEELMKEYKAASGICLTSMRQDSFVYFYPAP